MSQSTDDLLDALNDIEAAASETEKPVSQADHLLNALQTQRGDPSPDEDPSAKAEQDPLEDIDQLIEDTAIPEPSEAQDTSPPPPPAPSSNTQTVDAIALALEAAKAAQEAAESSQKSAELAIKNAQELKAQTVELSDANFAWRQTVRTATNEIKSAKNSFTLLTTVGVSFALIATSIMGYALYSLNKKYTELKSDVLDVIQTQNTLFQNKINTKIDELAALVEYLSSEIKTLKTAQPTVIEAPIHIHPEDSEHSAQHSSANETPHHSPEPSVYEPEMATEIMSTTGHEHTRPSEPNHATHAEAHVPAQPAHEGTPSHAAPESTHTPEHHAPHATSTEMPHVSTPSVTLDQTATLKKLEQLSALIQTILHKQQSLEQLVKQRSTAQPAVHSSSGQLIAKLSPAETKQLKAIRWLVSQQNKRLKHIEQTLKGSTTASSSTNSAYNLKQIKLVLDKLQKQVEALQSDQTQLRQEVQSLKEETKKLSLERPYYYRATDE